MTFVVKNAALVPIIRPPTFVAKLPPVPRKCSGNTFGKYSPKITELRDDQQPARENPRRKNGSRLVIKRKVSDRQHDQTRHNENAQQRATRRDQHDKDRQQNSSNKPAVSCRIWTCSPRALISLCSGNCFSRLSPSAFNIVSRFVTLCFASGFEAVNSSSLAPSCLKLSAERSGLIRVAGFHRRAERDAILRAIRDDDIEPGISFVACERPASLCPSRHSISPLQRATARVPPGCCFSSGKPGTMLRVVICNAPNAAA